MSEHFAPEDRASRKPLERRPPAETYRLSRLTRNVIEFLPVFILFPFWIIMSIPAIQDFGFQMVQEGYPVEVLTSICAMWGGILGLILAASALKHGESVLTVGFYVVFALGLIFLGGEEMAWGQDLLAYATPEFIGRMNTQHEMTLHNIEGWQGKNHLLRLAFGLGGMAGILLGRVPAFRSMAAPRLLHAWFVLIVLKSLIDIYVKSHEVGDMTWYIINQMSEVVEMMVSISGLLYVWLNRRMLIDRWWNVGKSVELAGPTLRPD